MELFVYPLHKIMNICIVYLFWSVITVGVVSSISAEETFEFKLVPSVKEVVHFENDSYIVSCHATNSRLRWLNPSHQWLDNRRGRVHVQERSNETVLIFTSISLADNGNWTCQAERDNSKIAFNMIVYKPITFVDTPVIQAVKENEDAIIKCMVTGDPEPTVSWYYNGQSLKIDNGKYALLADGLQIKQVHRNDSGEYTCKAFQLTPAFSNVKDQTIRLNVQHKPAAIVRESEDIQYGYLKGYVNITCEAEAEPPAVFRWYRKNKRLHDQKIFNGEHFSVLQLYLNNTKMFGEYVCEANNTVGMLRRTILLINGTQPPAPPYIQLRGSSTTLFDLDIGPKNDGKNGSELHKTNPMDIIEYRFELLTKEDHENDGGNWTNAHVHFRPFSYGNPILLEHLRPDTTYLIRVASRNEAGFSDWTGPQEFKTLAKVPFGSNTSQHLAMSVIQLLTIALVIHKAI